MANLNNVRSVDFRGFGNMAFVSGLIAAGTTTRRAGDKVLGVFVGELQRAGAPDPQIRLDKGRRSGVKSTL